VCAGGSGHAEVVRVTFDPAALPYPALLQLYFSAHDPTTPDRQGSDAGHQYRPLIGCHSPEQAEQAGRLVRRLQAQLALRGAAAATGPGAQGADVRGGIGIAAAAAVLPADGPAGGAACKGPSAAGGGDGGGLLLAPLLQLLQRWEQGDVATQVLAPGAWQFWPAEAYHASFYELNRGQGYCTRIIGPRLQRFREDWGAEGGLLERAE
jgi:peptide methionine sulfoxide reductase MsrA